MKRSLFVLVLLLSALVLVACPAPGPSLPSIKITPSSVTLGTGESQVFTATLSNGADATFTWNVKTNEGILSSITGKSVTYTAPATQGVYALTVDSLTANKAAIATVTVATRLNASGDPDTPVLDNGSIAAGATQRFIVNVPSGIFADTDDLLFFELLTLDPIRLSLYDDNQNLIAQSNDAEYFAKSLSTSSTLESQVVANLICRGPCVIVKKNAGTYYLKLKSTTAATYDLNIFPDVYADSNEPNETCGIDSAQILPNIVINPDPIEGAIETLDDVDCFVDAGVMTQIVLKTISTTAIKINAQILDAESDALIGTISVGPGTDEKQSTFSPGRRIKVLVTGDDQAGPGGNSRYTIDFEP